MKKKLISLIVLVIVLVSCIGCDNEQFDDTNTNNMYWNRGYREGYIDGYFGSKYNKPYSDPLDWFDIYNFKDE